MARICSVLVCLFVLIQISSGAVNKNKYSLVDQVKKCVTEWTKQIGDELYTLSSTTTRKRKIKEVEEFVGNDKTITSDFRVSTR
jgi:hypothetical protein